MVPVTPEIPPKPIQPETNETMPRMMAHLSMSFSLRKSVRRAVCSTNPAIIFEQRP